MKTVTITLICGAGTVTFAYPYETREDFIKRIDWCLMDYRHGKENMGPVRTIVITPSL